MSAHTSIHIIISAVPGDGVISFDELREGLLSRQADIPVEELNKVGSRVLEGGVLSCSVLSIFDHTIPCS